MRQTWRDNAHTLIGQADEQRQPFARADAEAISVPTLIIIGADAPGTIPSMSRALAAHVQGTRASRSSPMLGTSCSRMIRRASVRRL